jgi:PAS domain S-box-containing protein
LSELIDLPAVQKMANANYKASGMPIGIIDAFDGSILVGTGWQEICVKFHRANQESLKRCQASDNYIKNHLVKGDVSQYKCKNGLWDLGIPIIVAERHLATLFLGQFFYEGEIPDRDFFVLQANEFDYNLGDYLAALDQVPVFKHEKVDYIIEYNKSLVDFITDMAESSVANRNINRSLIESEQRYRRSAENSPDMIYRMSLPDGRYEYVSPASTSIYGYPPEQWYDNKLLIRDIIHPNWHSYFSEQWENLLNGHVPPTYEYKIIHKDGSIRWINQRNILVSDDNGSPVSLEGVVTDITERKLTEEAIKESEERFRYLSDGSMEAIFFTKKGFCLEANQVAVEMFGFDDRSQFIGKFGTDIIAPESYSIVKSHMLTDIFSPYEAVGMRKNGTRFPISIRAKTMPYKDEGIVRVTSITDITEIKMVENALLESDEDLKESQRIAHVGSWRLDIANNQLIWSDELYKMVGLDPAFPPPPYTDYQKLFTPESWERLSAATKNTIDTGIPYELELETLREGGSNRWMWMHGKTILDAKGLTVGLKGAAQDITERKRSEETLQKTEKQFRVIFEKSPYAMALTEIKSGHLVEVNDMMCEKVGIEKEYLIGKTTTELNFYSPENRARFTKLLLTDGKVDGLEMLFQTKNQVYLTKMYAELITINNSEYILTTFEDITERKRAEEALRKSEEKFRSLAENSADYIMRYDQQCRHLYLNPAGLQLLGMAAADLIGKTHRESGFPEDLCHLWEEQILYVFETADSSQIEFNFTGVHGSVFLELRLSPEFDTEGNVCSVLGVSRDITERKQAEDILKLHMAIMETVAEGIFLIGLEDNIIKWTNSKLEILFGYEPGEMVGMHVDKVNAPTEKTPAETRLTIVDVLRQNGKWHGEIKSIKKNGTHFWSYIHVSLFNHPEFGTVMVSAHTDITERKQAENALIHSHDLMRYIIEHNRSAVAVHDRDLRYIYISERYLDDYNVNERDVIGKHHYDVFPDLPQKWRDVHQKALSGEISSAEDDPYVREDGTVDWTRWECRPWYEANGSIGGIIVYTEVITERKKAEEEKAKLEGHLQQAQKMETIGSLAGGIAHDLNNILFPISGLSEMLLDDIPPDNPVHDSLVQIHKSAQRGSDLVKQILAFSRQSTSQKLPIRIQPILKEVLKLIRAAVPMNIEIISHFEADCGMIFANSTQVHQIAMNLITNAYHAVEVKGGTIYIGLKEVEIGRDGLQDISIQSGKYACITVSDTGTGIDPALIDKIFDPYFTTKDMGKGTGLGLSVVHGIVKEHGGDVRVYSEVGKGTAFHVYLPQVEDTKNSNTATVTRKYPTGCEL